jgi:hypothetical protein
LLLIPASAGSVATSAVFRKLLAAGFFISLLPRGPVTRPCDPAALLSGCIRSLNEMLRQAEECTGSGTASGSPCRGRGGEPAASATIAT